MKRLITAALPYVNNVPHLGNIIGCVLSADCLARYFRNRGYETLYVGGTDEYGTAVEMRAIAENKQPREICDEYHAIHKKIYEWFGISFDIFGRTSDPIHTTAVQEIFQDVDRHGVIFEQESVQFFDEKANTFLADRYLTGTCPACGFQEAHGDQCDRCGKLLSPEELINPVSSISKTFPVKKPTKHLFIDLPKIEPKLVAWLDKAVPNGCWSSNTVGITNKWLKEGLKPRSISRDLKWGVPVPKPGYEGKVFYVWFDAPIGYVSITRNKCNDWKDWWQNPADTILYQFMGKDNVPFHTVLFPAVLLSTDPKWTLVSNISTTDYLNYENTKFSKSRGIGVFGIDAMESGIDPDIWRYYLFANRPERGDSSFTWSDFQAKLNNELAANFGNLIHRVMTFTKNKLGGIVPAAQVLSDVDRRLSGELSVLQENYIAAFEEIRIKDALLEVANYARALNKYFHDSAPWSVLKTNRPAAETCLAMILARIRDLMILGEPFLPFSARTVAAQMNLPLGTWEDLGKPLPAGHAIGEPKPLFKQMDDKAIEAFQKKYSGK